MQPPEEAELHAVSLSWAQGRFNIQTAQFEGVHRSSLLLFSEAGFLLALCGGVKVDVSDGMEKYSCLDMLKRIVRAAHPLYFLSPFLLCQKWLERLSSLLFSFVRKTLKVLMNY